MSRSSDESFDFDSRFDRDTEREPRRFHRDPIPPRKWESITRVHDAVMAAEAAEDNAAIAAGENAFVGTVDELEAHLDDIADNARDDIDHGGEA